MESATAMIKERWGPLLDAGWAVVVGFIRGGGDHTAAWGKAGRRSGRLKSWQDMEAVIRDAQKTCHIGPAHSCIYGRSAGGYLVGALLGRNPGGNLFRGVYTEVPYVDVLQTTTNPTLPLTRIEYGEFGNPGESLADFITVGLSSPALTAALVPCPAVFVLARTALNDVQVYPYETIKWVRRLRENDMGLKNSRPKLTIVSGGQGHFTPPDEEVAQHGLDAAVLEELMD
jgi:oligopeptidase B